MTSSRWWRFSKTQDTDPKHTRRPRTRPAQPQLHRVPVPAGLQHLQQRPAPAGPGSLLPAARGEGQPCGNALSPCCGRTQTLFVIPSTGITAPKSALLARLWGTLQQLCRPCCLVLLLRNPWSYKNIRLIKCISQARNCCLFLSFLHNIPLLEYLLGLRWLYWKFCLISLEAAYHGLYWSSKLIGRQTAKRRGTTSGGIKSIELHNLCQ